MPTAATRSTRWRGTRSRSAREHPEYVPGYDAVFFADPDGIKLEPVHIPG